jgi:hypothetical protein
MKEFNRYKAIFINSKDKIAKEITEHKTKFNSSYPNKKGLVSPASLI